MMSGTWSPKEVRQTPPQNENPLQINVEKFTIFNFFPSWMNLFPTFKNVNTDINSLDENSYKKKRIIAGQGTEYAEAFCMKPTRNAGLVGSLSALENQVCELRKWTCIVCCEEVVWRANSCVISAIRRQESHMHARNWHANHPYQERTAPDEDTRIVMSISWFPQSHKNFENLI